MRACILCRTVGGRTERSFRIAPIAEFISPALPGAELEVRSDVVSWKPVPNAQAYFLYLGTSAGLRDLLSTGETQKTQISISSLPVGKRVFARLYTKFDGKWRYTDSEFRTRAVAYFTTPAPVALPAIPEIDDASQLLTWTSVEGSEAYFLYVGTQMGLHDIVSTGEISRTNHRLPTLAPGTTIYVRLYTKFQGGWDSFDQPMLRSTRCEVHNAIGARSRPRWPAPAGVLESDQDAEKYFLYLGSVPGARDLLSSGETTRTSFSIQHIPVGTKVYSRLYTKLAGRWRYVDSWFLVSPVAYVTSIGEGEQNVTVANPLTWTDVPRGQRLLRVHRDDTGLLQSRQQR